MNIGMELGGGGGGEGGILFAITDVNFAMISFAMEWVVDGGHDRYLSGI